jgi:hypothetical protein
MRSGAPPIIRVRPPMPEPDMVEVEVPAAAVEDALDLAQPTGTERGGGNFLGLFGRNIKTPEEPAAPASKPTAEETFDDDLEIPAFLRRSANT